MVDDVLTLTPDRDGRFRAHADETWFQGRGTYGGLPAAWLAEAGRRVLGRPDRRLRTLTVHLAAPVPAAPVFATTEVVREGTRVSQLAGRLVDGDGAVLATMLATFAASRPGASDRAGPALDLPPADAVPPMLDHPGLPAFARHHVDYRYGAGDPPWSGGEPGLGGWARFRAGATPTDTMLVALSDVWPPAILPALDRLLPAATVDLTLHLHEPLADDASPDDLYAYRADIPQVVDGWAEERASLWDRHGRRLMSIRQAVVVFG